MKENRRHWGKQKGVELKLYNKVVEGNVKELEIERDEKRYI